MLRIVDSLIRSEPIPRTNYSYLLTTNAKESLGGCLAESVLRSAHVLAGVLDRCTGDRQGRGGLVEGQLDSRRRRQFSAVVKPCQGRLWLGCDLALEPTRAELAHELDYSSETKTLQWSREQRVE